MEPPSSMGVVQRQPTANQLDADAEIEAEPQEESGESLQRQCADCAAEDGAGDEDKPPIQAKLTIGQPNDPYEQEADWVAEGVVNWLNAPKPAVGMAGGVGAIAQPQPIQTKSLVQRQEAKPSSEPENGGLKSTKSEGGNWLANVRQRILTNDQLYQAAQLGSDFFGPFASGVGLDVQGWIYGDLPRENEHAAVIGEITGMIAGTIATGGSSRVAQAVGMIIDIAGRGEQAYAALEAIRNRDYGRLAEIVIDVLVGETLGRFGGDTLPGNGDLSISSNHSPTSIDLNSRVPSPSLPGDPWHPDAVQSNRRTWNNYFADELIRQVSMDNIPTPEQLDGFSNENLARIASRLGGELVAEFKNSGVGQGAGRSGGHGTPYNRASSELARLATRLGNNHPLSPALRTHAERLRQRGSGHNHPGRR